MYIRVGTIDQKCDKNELTQRLLKYSGYYNDWSKLVLVLLDKIIQGKNQIGTDITKEEIDNLRKQGFVEISGTRYQKVFLSKTWSKKVGKTGNYTKMKGLNKDQKIQLVLNHIDDFEQVKLADLDGLFPELSKDQKANLLNRDMHRMKKIIKLVKPSNKKFDWYYVKTDNK